MTGRANRSSTPCDFTDATAQRLQHGGLRLMKLPGVYAIVHLASGRRYIGSSNDVPVRWKGHRSDLRRGVHHATTLQNAWNKDGEAAFGFVVLEDVPDLAVRIAREQWYIDTTSEPYNVLEIAGQGPPPGRTKSPFTCARLSAALKGKVRSAEHCRHISEAKRGKKNPAHGDKIRGKKASAETRAKMRESHLGLKYSDASRAKQSAALKGRTFTPEWREKLSASKRGKSWSQLRRSKFELKRLVSIPGEDVTTQTMLSPLESP
jgi:group I intron endonuclease